MVDGVVYGVVNDSRMKLSLGRDHVNHPTKRMFPLERILKKGMLLNYKEIIILISYNYFIIYNIFFLSKCAKFIWGHAKIIPKNLHTMTSIIKQTHISSYS